MAHTRHSRGAVWAAAAVLVLGPLAVGCSDDSDSGSATSPTPAATSPASPTEGAGPADPAAAEDQIEESWDVFFDPSTTTEQKVAVLENGEELRPALAAFSGDQNAAAVGAEVTGVEFTSPTEAEVTYDLLVDGVVVLPDTLGTAVEEDGVWKVSQKALCGLVSLSNDAPSVPGC
ncbi:MULTISPECIES: hypothetical protein [Streptomyces]